jgi:hypothetical protein
VTLNLETHSIWHEDTLRNRIVERAAVYFPDLCGRLHARISKTTRRAYSEIYELEITDDQRARRRIVVKKTQSARREYEELLFLWQTFSVHSGYGVARPLDYLEDGPALVMEAVGGASLQTIFPRWSWRAASVSSAESACHKAGKWLSLYQRTLPTTPLGVLDLDRKFSDFQRTWRDLAGVGFSERTGEKIAARLRSIVEQLKTRSFASVRIHGDFSIDNVWLDEGRIVVLDISGARRNAPELDIGAFLNSLLLMRIGGWMPLHVFCALRQAFFRGYGDQPQIDSLVVDFFQATGMLDVLWELWERRSSRFTRMLSRSVLTGLAEILDERID